MSPTLIELRSNDKKIFGGYTDIPWKNLNYMKKGNGNSFIFSFSEKTKHKNINPLKETNSTFSYFSFG